MAQFPVIVVTDPQTNKRSHKQTGPITIHCAAASAQCNYLSRVTARRCCGQGSNLRPADKCCANILYCSFLDATRCRSSSSSSSSSDRVDSRGPLRQPRVATTTSLGPFRTNAEGCTIADLLDPWMARASWPSPPTRT